MGFSVARVLNSFRGRDAKLVRPSVGQVVATEALDRWRDYPADGLTPRRLVSIFRAADEGSVDQAMALFEQMEEKDAHLYAVANKRRLALTGLGWQVVSAAEVRDGVDRVAADEAAAYCRETLNRIERFGEALQHLSLALGRNISVCENVWEMCGDELRLADVVPVMFDRLTFDDCGRVRIQTKAEPIRGIGLEPNKFVVHTPQTVSGHPMRGGLLRVSALSFLGKHFSVKDWIVFAEVFGMPVRVARYEPSATPEEKRELLRMLQSLGTDASGVFSKAVELELLESGGGKSSPPYEKLCSFFNREISKAWLGETLTTDAEGTSASLAAAKVHNEIRLDLRQDDIQKEGRTIRRDILRPMTRMTFGADVPVPFFRRQYQPPRDLRELADVLDTAVNSLGMDVSSRWVHDSLGIPEAGDGDRVLPGAGA